MDDAILKQLIAAAKASGVAIDVNADGTLNRTSGLASEWLAKHAGKFGLSLRGNSLVPTPAPAAMPLAHDYHSEFMTGGLNQRMRDGNRQDLSAAHQFAGTPAEEREIALDAASGQAEAALAAARRHDPRRAPVSLLQTAPPAPNAFGMGPNLWSGPEKSPSLQPQPMNPRDAFDMGSPSPSLQQSAPAPQQRAPAPAPPPSPPSPMNQALSEPPSLAQENVMRPKEPLPSLDGHYDTVQPQTPAPPITPPQPTSLWDRIKEGASAASGALGKAGDNLMPVPDGMESLLSPNDISKARRQGLTNMGLSLLGNASGVGGGNAPSLGQAFGSGVGAAQQTFNSGIQNAVQAQQVAQKFGETQRIQKVRQSMAQLFPMHPGMTQSELNDQTQQMYNYLARTGDEAGAKMLEHVAGEAAKVPKEGVTKEAQAVRGAVGMKGGQYEGQPVIQMLDPKDPNHVLREILEAAPPVDPEARAIKQAFLALAQQNAQGASDQRHTQHIERGHTQFVNATKPAATGDDAYRNFATALDEAETGNKTAYKPAIIAFVRASGETGAQLRQGVLNYISQVDPSIVGKINQMWDKNWSGLISPEIAAGMRSLADRQQNARITEYNQMRDWYIKTDPGYESAIAPAEARFLMPRAAAPTGVKKVPWK